MWLYNGNNINNNIKYHITNYVYTTKQVKYLKKQQFEHEIYKNENWLVMGFENTIKFAQT